ncbi:MAG: hypothetical protein U9N19_02990 [Thermodesulfobacteriota bacterium]|nr:hypothetical protein [Thermodesulfobacteriota bacterium]
MSLKAGIIGIIRKPGEYQALRRLRGRKKPIGRIPQGFARDLLKKYRRTTGLARGSLFYLALFGRAGCLTRNIYRSYRFSIAINNRIFLSIFRIGRPGLLRSGEKYPVDYVAYSKGAGGMGLQGPPSRFKIPTAGAWIERLLGPGTEYGNGPASQWRPFRPIPPALPHAQVRRKFTLDKHRSFTAYASLRMPELGIQGPVARAPSASLAGSVSTAIFPVSVSNLALYPAFRMDFLNSLYRHEEATRFPVLYAAKTSGIIGSHSKWMRNDTALWDSMRVLRSVRYHSQPRGEVVHVPGTSAETPERFRRSWTGVPTVPFRVQAGRVAIDAAGIGTPVLGVRPGRIRTDVIEKLIDTPAPESRPVSFGRPSGKAVSSSFPYHRPGHSWPSVSSGVKEFQHDTVGYTTTVIRLVMRFANSRSSIRSMLSGRSTQALRSVSYRSPASLETVHILDSSSETQHKFRPGRAGVRTVPFQVQADRVEVDAARFGTPILDVRQGRIRTEMVEKSGSTSATELRPVSFGRPSSKAVSGSFPYHGPGHSWPSVSSGVKEFQRDTTGYMTTVVRPVTRFANSISSIRSMLSGKSTQVLRPVGHQSQASGKTVYVLGSSSETQHQFRPGRAGVHTVPFQVQTDRLGIAAARIGTPILDIRQGRIQTDVTGELGVTRALDSRPVSSGESSGKAVSGSFPYHGPSRSWPVVPVMQGPYRVLTGSGRLLVRPAIPQKNIPLTAQLPPDAQPYKQDTKDVTPRGDNTFAIYRMVTGRDTGRQSKSYAPAYIHNTFQSPAGIRKTEILHKPYTNTISQRIMRNIELISNHHVHRVMGQKPGGDGLHGKFFPSEGHGFPWMPASRSRDRGLEMAHVPLRLPESSSGTEGHTKEGAGTAPVRGSLQVKGPDMSGTLPVPEVDAHSLANRVYGLIVERVKREVELRGR